MSDVEENMDEEDYAEDDALGDSEAVAQEGDDKESSVAEEGEQPDDSEYVTSHGHKEYRVPLAAMIHEAANAMPVVDGKTIGRLLSSKGGKLWQEAGLKWSHISIMGGESSTSGKVEQAPMVCFAPHDCATDDPKWLRSVPSAVMEYMQPIWADKIKNKKGISDDQRKKVFDYYRPVLRWVKTSLSSPKLDPVTIHGFKVLSTKLTSLRQNPDVVPRGQKSEAKAKIAHTIAKGGNEGAASSSKSDDVQCKVPDAKGKVTLLGLSADIHTFIVDGKVFMATIP